MKILLTGKNGMVGWELNRSLLPLGDVIAMDRTGADLSRPESLRQVVREIGPDVIVNAAAYTAVDKAEDEEELAMTINGIAPGVLGEEARRCGALIVHYSTDYVFDGTKESPYIETDTPNPVNVYGRSKLAGERAIEESGADFLIFRTSWVYASRGKNFLLTMMRLMQEREELRVVADQIGAPTWARTIADTTAHCIKQSVAECNVDEFESGIFNLSAKGYTSWHGFAEQIFEYTKHTSRREKHKVKEIQPINTIEYPTPAQRPTNSKMSTDLISREFGINIPVWKITLGLCLSDL